ncbi:DsbE family thiol:disulfide interchange protein [Bradyrhizobium prioriisuperbiae]|uniref:DsbE family thiol:disulfide interchange protein n=1 Tax=Bradyrhizobium prioriisuperbiae TaxID=2854389 RepID=UPI0028E94E5E|nr:DsbE family thiol:disulfide interchange protein [Bradyrhizobium prioritasuperba]
MSSDVQPNNQQPAPRRRSWLVAVPLIVFAGLAAIFWFRLGSGDPSKIPSALIGRPAPQMKLPALDGLVSAGAPVPGLDPAALQGRVSIVNVWASWCVPCHDEAPLLLTLGKELRAKGVQMIGINQKDAPDNARRFLGRYGNPFDIVGVDGNGRGSIEWGVYGVPETFVVGRDGRITYKLIGGVTPENVESKLRPEIVKALAAGS